MAAMNALTEEQKQYVALDCEMVMVSVDGAVPEHALAQIAIVDWNGALIYKTYVKPNGVIVDFLTQYSGIEPKHMEDAPSFDEVRNYVITLLTGKIIVGHGLASDFKVLGIPYDASWVRNTATANIYQKNVFNRRTGEMRRGARRLKNLAAEFLHENIQEGAHDPEIDARTAMMLFRHARDAMEPSPNMSLFDLLSQLQLPQSVEVAMPATAAAAPQRAPFKLSAAASEFIPSSYTGGKSRRRKHRRNNTRKQRK